MPITPEEFKELPSVYPFVFNCECERRLVCGLNTQHVKCPCGKDWKKRPGFLFCRGELGTTQIPVREPT